MNEKDARIATIEADLQVADHALLDSQGSLQAAMDQLEVARNQLQEKDDEVASIEFALQEAQAAGQTQSAQLGYAEEQLREKVTQITRLEADLQESKRTLQTSRRSWKWRRTSA